MNKKELTEADIRTKFITPALVPPGGKWDLMSQLREEVYFTKGRVIVRGKTVKRGDAKKADYLLYYKPGIPIAVIEAEILSVDYLLHDFEKVEADRCGSWLMVQLYPTNSLSLATKAG